MTYDDSLYLFSRGNDIHEATLLNGACLYRLTSLSHSAAQSILTGQGTERSPSKGRYNAPQQKTTYAANNILVNISEVLYHLYRNVLYMMKTGRLYSEIYRAVQDERCLVVLKVQEIQDLVYADCEGVRVDYNVRFAGTPVVFPDDDYAPFWDFNNTVRQAQKRGVMYPSARHSKDLCIALFYDETNSIVPQSDERLIMKLQLIAEDQDPAQPLRRCDPFKDKLHPTMGHYSFVDDAEFTRLRNANMLYPKGIPQSGMVDFVRRQYQIYPSHAVR